MLLETLTWEGLPSVCWVYHTIFCPSIWYKCSRSVFPPWVSEGSAILPPKQPRRKSDLISYIQTQGCGIFTTQFGANPVTRGKVQGSLPVKPFIFSNLFSNSSLLRPQSCNFKNWFSKNPPTHVVWCLDHGFLSKFRSTNVYFFSVLGQPTPLPPYDGWIMFSSLG